MSSNAFHLTPEDNAILTESLKLFIANDIEGISLARKQQINSVAFNIILKLNSNNLDFTDDQFLVMYNSLDYFKDNIEEINTNDVHFNKDTVRYIKILSKLLNTIEEFIS